MTPIICPNCQHQFEPNDAYRAELRNQLNAEAKEWQRKREADFAQKENDMKRLMAAHQAAADAKLADLAAQNSAALEAQRQQVTAALQEQARQAAAKDFENRLLVLTEQAEASAEKLREARHRELEFLRKEEALKAEAEERQLAFERDKQAARAEMLEAFRKDEAERLRLRDEANGLKTKELETQLDAQRKLVEEMRRRVEQGSMQLQGEAQEMVLEDLLRASFPFDELREVGKGVRGADCLQTVRNKLGQTCGTIIFESKRTQHFSAEWIEKLKADLRKQGADVGVIVTQAMPKDMDRFGEKDGVWVCNYAEVKALVQLLRDGLIKVAAALKSQENKGDKMVMLYNYLTGNEFSEQWKAIREGFFGMRQSIQKERDAMEKLWKAREKQLEKVLLNLAGFKGSIEGIAGQDFALEMGDDPDEGAERHLLA
jgi:hypothetical protein